MLSEFLLPHLAEFVIMRLYKNTFSSIRFQSIIYFQILIILASLATATCIELANWIRLIIVCLNLDKLHAKILFLFSELKLLYNKIAN
jgi:hypothetical protein